ncbi:Carboxy-terminal processing protease CtpA precursor [compost metagenome]
MKNKIGKYALVGALMAGSFGLGVGVSPLKVKAETTSFATFLNVYDLIKGEYVESKLDDTKLIYGAIRGMLASLDDPYTRFMDPKAYSGMQEERAGSFSGIGIQIGMKGKQLSVIAPMEGTPAARAGLKAGDAILEIDGKPTKDMAIEEAVTHIRGPRGSTVKLKVQAEDAGAKPKVVPIVRDNIVTKAVKVEELDGNIGYIRLNTFMANDAADEVKNALNKFKGKSGLIIDLRGNPGGLLPNAIDIGSMFIKDGPIVHVVNREGEKQSYKASGKVIVDSKIPVAVLVDGGSASASEILGGALQDTKRAVLIGTKTFGKGLVQTVHPLSDGSGVAITTNKYLTPAGHDIHKKGIEPDIKVEIPKIDVDKDGQPVKNGKKLTPEDLKKLDTQLERAKVWLRTKK